jgi:phosphoribosyl 1,2-cyclic phosphodiesterase
LKFTGKNTNRSGSGIITFILTILKEFYLKIKILGNGGAINDGLPYNSFIIDEFLLIESPPDIIDSLYREKIDLSKIQIIYISHFHGDHYFGLPFITLRIFFNSIANQNTNKIKIIGPENIKIKTKEICKLAVGENHPLHQWIENNIIFIEINSNQNILIDNNIILKCFTMHHFIETWGFSFYNKEKILFSYFSDTLWDDKLIEQIQLYPKIIITDLNGEPSDPMKIHLSENDLLTKAIEVTGDKTIFYGTHLKYQKESLHKNIKYVYPGEIIDLN